MHPITALTRGLLVLGMLLLPFSLGPEDESYVFAWGLPFLALYCLIRLMGLAGGVSRLSRDYFLPVMVGFLYAFIALLFSFASENVTASLMRGAVTVLGFGLFLATLAMTRTEAASGEAFFATHLKILYTSGFVMGVYYLANVFEAAAESGYAVLFTQRYVGGVGSLPWGATNTVAAAMLFPLMGALIALQTPYRTKWTYVCFATILAAIITTVSRNALTCLALSGLALTVFSRRWNLLIAFAVVAGVFLLVADDDLLQLLYATRIEHYGDNPLEDRENQWSMVLDHLMSHPLQPVGYYGSQYFFGSSAHNVFLTALVEQSVIGLVTTAALYLMPIAWIIERFREAEGRQARTLLLTMLVAMLAFLLNVQAEDAHFTQPYMIYFWYLMAILYTMADQVAARDRAAKMQQRPVRASQLIEVSRGT